MYKPNTHIKLNPLGQVKFDYTGAELLINYFSDTPLWAFDEPKIIDHPAYKHILLHSQKFSSQPLTEVNLLNSLKGNLVTIQSLQS